MKSKVHNFPCTWLKSENFFRYHNGPKALSISSLYILLIWTVNIVRKQFYYTYIYRQCKWGNLIVLLHKDPSTCLLFPTPRYLITFFWMWWKSWCPDAPSRIKDCLFQLVRVLLKGNIHLSVPLEIVSTSAYWVINDWSIRDIKSGLFTPTHSNLWKDITSS